MILMIRTLLLWGLLLPALGTDVDQLVAAGFRHRPLEPTNAKIEPPYTPSDTWYTGVQRGDKDRRYFISAMAREGKVVMLLVTCENPEKGCTWKPMPEHACTPGTPGRWECKDAESNKLFIFRCGKRGQTVLLARIQNRDLIEDFCRVATIGD